MSPFGSISQEDTKTSRGLIESIMRCRLVQGTFAGRGKPSIRHGIRRTLGLFAIALTGCAAPKGGTKEADGRALSPEDTAVLASACERGREVFIHDVANTKATDAARAAGVDPRALGTKAFIELKDPDGWRVAWVRKGDPPMIVVQVKLGAFPFRQPRVERLDPPVALTGSDLAEWKARLRAEEHAVLPCDAPYNSVVLPVAGGHDVCLLASTTDPDVLISGGHVRMHVPDSGEVTAHPLNKGCMMMRRSEDEGEAAGIGSTFLKPYPNEGHVYVSLWYGLPYYVGTPDGRVWNINAATCDRAIREAR
jgi:hypothetical protein